MNSFKETDYEVYFNKRKMFIILGIIYLVILGYIYSIFSDTKTEILLIGVIFIITMLPFLIYLTYLFITKGSAIRITNKGIHYRGTLLGNVFIPWLEVIDIYKFTEYYKAKRVKCIGIKHTGTDRLIAESNGIKKIVIRIFKPKTLKISEYLLLENYNHLYTLIYKAWKENLVYI